MSWSPVDPLRVASGPAQFALHGRDIPARSSSSSAGSPARASRSLRDGAEHQERDAVVELLKTEVAAARRESLNSTTELVEVREEYRVDAARCEQEKIRLNSRLRSQKARLDEVLLLEMQATEERESAETELQALQFKIKGQDRVHHEERLRERNGAQSQLGKLKQRFKDTEEEKADLRAACARQEGEVEAIGEIATEKAVALEQQEREFSRLSVAKDGVQAALEASSSEANVLAQQLASMEESHQRSLEEHDRTRGEMSEFRASARKAETRADEEARCSAELRFELLHALHHELPTERNRVMELESRERARAERLRGVCEAEVSDLPSDLMEKVQGAIRRHESWWTQWSSGPASKTASPSQRGRRPLRQEQSSSNSTRSPSPTLVGVNVGGIDLLANATSRYEAVLGALAQCAGASARENMELRARLGTPGDEMPPEISRRLTGLKREVAKVREDNQELRIHRQQQDDAIHRLKQEHQAREEASLLHMKASRKAPPPSAVGFHTEHRRKVRVYEAEVRQAERQMEIMRGELSEQQLASKDTVDLLEQQVRELQSKDAELSGASSAPAAERFEERQLKRRIEQLEAELDESQAARQASVTEAASSSSSASIARRAARRAYVRKRLKVVGQRLGQISGDSGLSDLLQLCDPLCGAAVDCSRLTHALAEERRARDAALDELQIRLKGLETALAQNEDRSRSLEEEASARLEERNVAVQELEALVARGARVSSPSTEQSTPTKVTSDESTNSGVPTKPPSATGSGRVSYRDVDRGHDKARLPSFEQLVLKRGVDLPSSSVASTSASSTPQPAVQTRPQQEEVDRKSAGNAESNLIQRWVRAAIDMPGDVDPSNSEDLGSMLELSPSRDLDQEPALEAPCESNGVCKDVVSLGDPPDAPAAAPTQDIVSLGDGQEKQTFEQADGADASQISFQNGTSEGESASSWKKVEVEEMEEVDLLEKDSKSLELKQKEDADMLEKETDSASPQDAAVEKLEPGISKGQWRPKVDEAPSRDLPQEAQESSGDHGSPPLTPRSSSHGWLSRLGIDFGSPEADETTCPEAAVEVEVDTSSIDIRSPSSSTPAGNGDDADNSGQGVPAADAETFAPVDPAFATETYKQKAAVDAQVYSDFVSNSCSTASSLGLSRRRLPPVAEERDPRVIEETELEEVFQQATMFCDSQRYEEALPLFHELLMLLQEADAPSMRSLEAEARAHLGVALQSLGRVEDAIAAYCSAVEQDPSLHVCHANLAQLHAYLEDRRAACAHIELAISLDPNNELYRQLDEQFRAAEVASKLSS